MKQGALQNRWIIVEDKAGEKIGKICVRADNPKNVRSRLMDMQAQIGKLEKEFRHMAEIDPQGACFDRLNEYEQTVIDAIQRGFGASSLETLFAQHRPLETVNGKGYFQIVVCGLLDGLKRALNQNRQVVTVQIDA